MRCDHVTVLSQERKLGMGLTNMMATTAAFVTTIAANSIVRHGFRIAVIVIAVIVIERFAHRAIERIVRRAVTPDRFDSPEAERTREDTLIRIFDGTAHVIAWFIAIFFILTELGVSVTPFITAAGTLGLAMSIGGQHFTRDLIAGMCITYEDQYRVGDVVCINGITGVVKDLTLRITVLRDADNVEHYLQHGLITTVANFRERGPLRDAE